MNEKSNINFKKRENGKTEKRALKNFLAVDTSCNYLTVVVAKNGETFTTHIPDCAMRHSVSLMNAVDETLKKANMHPSECDFFAAVVGAGSFTGIRIGISVAKGFCLAYEKPALPVTSFDVAAYNAIDKGQGKTLCLVDALHDSYYVCGYDEKGEVCYAAAYLTEEEVLDLAKNGKYRLCACAKMPICEKTTVEIVDPAEGLQKAVAALLEKEAFGGLTALYIRKSSAEINLKGEKA